MTIGGHTATNEGIECSNSHRDSPLTDSDEMAREVTRRRSDAAFDWLMPVASTEQ